VYEPILYRYFILRLLESSDGSRKISISKVKETLSKLSHFPKCFLQDVLIEMRQNKMIDFDRRWVYIPENVPYLEEAKGMFRKDKIEFYYFFIKNH